MKAFEFIRTALFVPGNRPDRVDKAVGTAADVVIVDLEDAVPYSQKKEFGKRFWIIRSVRFLCV
jgi:hypothetical protein